MAAKAPKFVAKKFDESSGSSTSSTQQSTLSQKYLDDKLLNTILSGLSPRMTDEEISAYAESLLAPQLNAGIEAAQQAYETTRLSKEQEIENIAAALARSIQEQQGAYAQSMANVETAALGRGMGRSSYTLQTLANQGNALARAVQQLSEDSARQQGQIQQQITQAAQQNAQTQGRLNTDYAANLAAKIQELRQNQQTAFNQNYMTAVSAAMGSKSDTSSSTESANNTMNISGKIQNGGGGSYTGIEQKSGVAKPTTVRLTQKV